MRDEGHQQPGRTEPPVAIEAVGPWLRPSLRVTAAAPSGTSTAASGETLSHSRTPSHHHNPDLPHSCKVGLTTAKPRRERRGCFWVVARTPRENVPGAWARRVPGSAGRRGFRSFGDSDICQSGRCLFRGPAYTFINLLHLCDSGNPGIWPREPEPAPTGGAQTSAPRPPCSFLHTWPRVSVDPAGGDEARQGEIVLLRIIPPWYFSRLRF